MAALAWIIAAGMAFSFLPGQSYKGPRKEVDWQSPHAYVTLVTTFAVFALVLKVLL